MHLAEYARLDGIGLAALVAKKEVTPRELAELALEAIERVNPDLNGTIQTFPERARQQPAVGPFSGVPILNKDISCQEKGVAFEMGSELARGFVPSEDSIIFSRLRRAGFMNMGRTTTPEFGLAGVTESPIAGITRNPWNSDHTPGGSSGGSCAMVAAGAVPIASASDGGGSIRSPASHCGLVGLKPTRGRVPTGPSQSESNNGLGIAFAVTRTMRDCAAVLDAVQGTATGDHYAIAPPARCYKEELKHRPRGLRIAYSTTPWVRECDVEVQDAVNKALRVLEQAGHHIEEARPAIDYVALMAASLKVWCANTAASADAIGSALGRKPGPDNLQSATWAFCEAGRKLLATDLLDALAVFNTINRQAGQFFDSYDVLVLPSCLAPAPRIGALDCNPKGEIDPHTWNEQVSKLGVFMPLFNITGQPAISLPLHQSAGGLPIGVQLAARFGDEATLITLGALLEEALPWIDRRPPLHVSGNLR